MFKSILFAIGVLSYYHYKCKTCKTHAEHGGPLLGQCFWRCFECEKWRLLNAVNTLCSWITITQILNKVGLQLCPETIRRQFREQQ